MSDHPTADQPAPFPSLPTPTSSTSAPKPPGSAPAPGHSYDDLVRKHVPLPDSSHRPTHDEAVAAEVPHDLPDQITMRDALQALQGVDIADLQVDVAGGTATLVGSVARSIDRERITTALGKVPGVVEIIDRLRIRLE